MGGLKATRPTAGVRQAAGDAQTGAQTLASTSLADPASQFVNRAIYLLMNSPESPRYRKAGVRTRAMVALFLANHLRVHSGRVPLTTAISTTRIQLHLPYATTSRIVREFVRAGLLTVEGGDLTWR